MIGVLDVIKTSIADKFAAEDGHHQALQSNAGELPLLGEAVRQAGLVVSLDTMQILLVIFSEAGRTRGACLRGP